MIYNIEESQKAFELDVQLEGLALAPVKNEGDEIATDSFRQGFTPKYPALTYAKGFNASKEALQDELYGQLSKKAQLLAFSITQTEETVGAAVLNNGFNSAFTMIDGDGLELFSTVHVNGPSGGTFSNELATPADLTEASLEDLLTQIGQATDARGLNISIQPIRLIVPVPLQWEAQRILGSVLQNDTGNNATNAIRDSNALREGHTMNHYLTDTDAWFIKTNAPQGLTRFNRQAVQFGEDNAFTSGNARFKADIRFSVGWTEPRGMYASAGS
jgi:hypothetical protein